MGGMSTDQRRRQMQGFLAHREREGLTYAELAAECGIPAGTLASWQHRLRREEDVPCTRILIGAPGQAWDRRMLLN